ncbi:MAG: hypothetical protein AAGC55_15505, partial [Myxococcota bacterium]
AGGAAARQAAEDRERLRQLLENTVVIERRPYFINFIPFGAGQFQNGHRRKGIALFVSQAALAGTSMGLFWWQVSAFGFSGSVAPDRIDTVNRVQALQLTTGGLCLALMAYGIIDSLIYYQSATRVPADPSLLPQLSGTRRGPGPTPARAGLRLVPMAGPSSAGMLMSLEF